MSLEELPIILMWFTAFIISGSIHEFFHAYSAYYLGDTTAKNNGRMTINPLVHIDIFGTIIFPIMGALSGFPVIGWMKGVPINPLNFRKPSQGQAISAFAGPFSNLLQASFAIILLKIALLFWQISGGTVSIILSYISTFIYIYLSVNILLLVFNLLPVPPLDGGWILRHALPERMQDHFDRIYPYGIILLYILVFTGALRLIFTPFLVFTNFLYTLILTSNIFLLSIPFLILATITLIFFRENVYIFFHRIKHGSKTFKSQSRKSFKSSRKEKDENQQILKQGVELLKKVKTGQKLDAIEEIKLLDLKLIRNRHAQECKDNTFTIDDYRCKKCTSYANCLYKSIEETR